MSGYARWDEPRVERLRKMWADNVDVATIADELGSSRGGIYTKARSIGLGRRRARGRPRLDAPAPGPARDLTRQRRFTGVGESAGQRVRLNDWHPALRNGSTIFGQLVVPAARAERLLKSGEHNRKIGKVATKGRWAGMPIFTLTLEERATCPRSCLEWKTCYGNNMGHAPRIVDDGTLTRRLWSELCFLNATTPNGFIVRLHVLGDFYSVEYVEFWRQSVAEFSALRIFGFTARQPDDPIGWAVLRMMEDCQERVLIRVSGGAREDLCSEVVDSDDQATGIVCPAERDAERCCATCGLCWTSARTITFLRH